MTDDACLRRTPWRRRDRAIQRLGWHCFDCWRRELDTGTKVSESQPVRLKATDEGYRVAGSPLRLGRSRRG
jgi:hypothetical protein